MYSKEQASRIRQEFWTTFGQYMSPVPNADGQKINWINYRTGEKHIHFKMDAGNRSASIFIEIAHPDATIQQLYFEQFQQMQALLHQTLGEEWQWTLHQQDEYGKVTSSIGTNLPNTSILDKTKWPVLISFFKPRIIALDEFWSAAKYAFELLR
jgi:hypothetical protein